MITVGKHSCILVHTYSAVHSVVIEQKNKGVPAFVVSHFEHCPKHW